MTAMTSRVKLAALAAACALGIAGIMFHDHGAVAQTAGLAKRLVPGGSVEMIGPAAVVISTVHYQAAITLTCGGNNCGGDFTKPGANCRLNATRISCVFAGDTGSTYSDGKLELRTAADVALLAEWLPVNSSASNGAHMISRAVDLQVAATQHLSLYLALASGSSIGAKCTVTGTLSTLG